MPPHGGDEAEFIRELAEMADGLARTMNKSFVLDQHKVAAYLARPKRFETKEKSMNDSVVGVATEC